MSDFQVLVLSLTSYKLVTLVIGMIFGVLGYKLFSSSSGIQKKAGEMQTTWGDKSLILKSAAPGTFFALFGTVLISTTLIRGLSIEAIKSWLPPRDTATPLVSNPSTVPNTGEEKVFIEKVLKGESLNEKEKSILQRYVLREETLRGVTTYP